MNTQNTLYAIDRDLNALYHFGVKGQRKHQHDPNRRWQRQAVYANGQSDPNAKERIKSAVGNAVNKAVSAKARFDAKNDAARDARRRGGINTRGNKRLGKFGDAGSFAGMVIGAQVGSKKFGPAGALYGGLAGGIAGASAMNKLGLAGYKKRAGGESLLLTNNKKYMKEYKNTFDKYKDEYMKKWY